MIGDRHLKSCLVNTVILKVEVDEFDVQQKLGRINMDFVRKAEKRNKERASMHRFISVQLCDEL